MTNQKSQLTHTKADETIYKNGILKDPLRSNIFLYIEKSFGFLHD